MSQGRRLAVSQQHPETTPKKSPVDFLTGYLSSDIDFVDIMSSKDRERLAQRDILREAGEEYVPLDESTLRIIEIQRRVTRIPRWDRAIYESLADLKEKVSDLQRQVGELTEAVQETAKIYNATIYELGNSEYELTMPLQIVLEEDQEETVARIPELNLYASADTDSEAINELKQEVIKLYEDLETSDRTLGPLPESWLETLRKLIVRKNR